MRNGRMVNVAWRMYCNTWGRTGTNVGAPRTDGYCFSKSCAIVIVPPDIPALLGSLAALSPHTSSQLGAQRSPRPLPALSSGLRARAPRALGSTPNNNNNNNSSAVSEDH